MKGKLFNSGLHSLIVATGPGRAVATTETIATTHFDSYVTALQASVGVAVDLKLA